MKNNIQQSKEFIRVIHECILSLLNFIYFIEELTMEEMGMVYSDMGDKAYL